MPFRKHLSLGFFCAVGCLLPSICVSKPTGFKLRSGEARSAVQAEAGAFVIESGRQAAIDWESFSIGADEHVRFQQFDGKSYVVNRVVGPSGSEVLGRLSSNGAVYLINPNGVFIGPQALVETAGFIASTLDLLDKDLSGELHFSGESDAGVVNRGVIRCAGGDLFLIGQSVENSGTLEGAREGLLTGCDVVIRSEGMPQVFVRARGEIDRALLEKNPYAIAIQHSGACRAREAYLIADEGTCEVSGEIVASQVRVLGTNVHLLDGTRIDASGEKGGGEVLIGGDYQGNNADVRNAERVWVGKDVEVKVDALEEGDGGKVIFWGDESTAYYGTASACGGPLAGDGGLVEVSGKRLKFEGMVHTEAPRGKTGVLLLDPTDVIIASTADSGGTFSSCDSGTNNYVPDSSATDYINTTTLQNALASCNVTISTVGSSGSGPNSGAITVSNAVSWSTSNTLTLTAASYIAINATLSCTSTSSTEFTAMNFTANGTGATDIPGFTVTANLTTGGGSGAGDIILSGTSSTSTSASYGFYANGGSVTTYSGNITATGIVPSGATGNNIHGMVLNTTNPFVSTSGNITVVGSTQASGDNCNGLTGGSWNAGTTGTLTIGTMANPCQGGASTSAHGINYANITTNGTMTIYGVAGRGQTGGGSFNTGVLLSGTNTAGGNLIITGTTTSTTVGRGVWIGGGTTQTTGNGSITITGSVGTNVSSNSAFGVYISGGVVKSVNGNISITGSIGAGTTFAGNGVQIDTTNGVVSTSGNITIAGDASGDSGNSSHGVSIADSWTTSTSGTTTFQNCFGGTGTGSNGVNFGNTFTSSGDVVFTNCVGGTNNTTAGNGINVAAAFSTSGSIFATNTITNIIMGGAGSGGRGFVQSANFNSTGGGNITIIAGSNSTSGDASGIYLSSGTMNTSTGQITLNGTSGVSSGACAGFEMGSPAAISTTGTNGSPTAGLISITALSQGSAGSDAIFLNSSSSQITSTYGQIQLTGSSTSSGSGSSGIFVNSSWTPVTSGTITFAGTGSTNVNSQSAHGFVSSGSFTGSGPVVFSNCTGCNNSTSGGNGIKVTAAFTTAGSISTVGTCTGQGNGGIGFASSANFSATGSNNSITINAAGTGAAGACHGISLTGGTLSTNGGGSITLTGTAGTGAQTGHGVSFAGGVVSTSTGNGNIFITGTVPVGATNSVNGVNMATTNGIVSSSGNITVSGITNSSGVPCYGVHTSSSWTTGTTGTFTFTNCVGGPDGGGGGIVLQAAFSTSGNVIATNNIQSGGGSGGLGFYTNSNFSSTGGGSIQITATAATTTGSIGDGIALDSAAVMSTTGSGSITLIGFTNMNATSGTASGVIFNIDGGNKVVTVNGNINIAGQCTAGSGTANGYGVYLASTSAGQISSTTGNINVSGMNAATGSGSYGVYIASAWTPVTTGTVTFGASISDGTNIVVGCIGGSGSASHGINVGAAFTAAGNVVATNQIQGGSGSGSIGFNATSNFTTSGMGSTIQIIAGANGTTPASGAAHGISITGGSLSTTGGGTITLNGTGSSSGTAAHGINLTGGASTISTTTGNGAISLTGAASGSGAASFGVNIAGSAAGVINSTSGPITITGTSTASVTGSHGAAVAAAWTPATTGTVTFSGCTGSNTGASHGVNFGTAFTGNGPVVFTNCMGGTGGSNGVNVAAAFTTVGNVTGSSLTGQGAGGAGFASSVNFSVTGAVNTINLTANAAGATGACHGITLTGGSMSSVGGTITLNGTSGMSSTASYGVNLSSSANSITSASGLINITGTSQSTVAGSSGVSINTNPWSAGTAGALSLGGTAGSTGPSYGVDVGQALTNVGPITFSGGSGTFANHWSADITTSGGSVTTSGTTLLGSTVVVDTTNGGGTPAGANIVFSDSGATVDGTQNLTLQGGTGGIVTLDGGIGQTTSLGVFTIASAGVVNIGANITANSFAITGTPPVTLTGSSIINVSANAGGSISFSSTIDGTSNGLQTLTLTANTTGTVTLNGNVGSNIQLGAVTITGGTSGFSIGAGVSSIEANSFTVGGTVLTTLNNTSPLTINTSNHSGGSISFDGSITGASAGVQALTLTANGTGTVTFLGNVGATRLGALAIGAGTGALSIGTGVTSIAANSFAAPSSAATTLNNTGTLTINTSGNNGTITLASTVDGATSGAQILTLQPGTGNVALTGVIGSITPLGAIAIPSATTVTAVGITAASFTQNMGVGTTTFNGILNLTGDLNVMGNNFAFNAPITTVDNVIISNSGLLTISAAADMTLTGAFSQSSGLVQTAGDVFTTNQDITFGGGVTLTGNVELNTGDTEGTIAFNNTVNGGYNLLLTGGTITFHEVVGGTPLNSLQANAAYSISISEDQTVSSGPMIYNGTVQLQNPDITLTNNGSNAMEFLLPASANGTDSIVGNYALSLLAPSTSITVDGDIDLSGSEGSSGANGGSLSARAGTGIVFGGQVLTQGGIGTMTTGGIGGNVSLTCPSGSISIHNINATGGDGITMGGNGGTILIQASSGYSGGYPIGIIVLNSDLSPDADGNLVSGAGTGATAGTITLSSNRASPATVATITSSLSGNDITIIGKTIEMGANEAMTVFGNLEFVGTTVTLGDTVALEALDILAETINLLTHGPYEILAETGLLYTTPTLHFFGGTGYTPIGTLNPSNGALNAQDLDLSPSTFRPLLIYSDHILNYDTSPRPTPFVASEGSKQFALYQLGIANAQLSDMLPTYRIPLPFPAFLK